MKIERRRQLELFGYLSELAKRRSPNYVALEPYAPLRRQLLLMLRAINRQRERLGYALIPTEILPLKRQIVGPFAPPSNYFPRD